MDSHHHLFDGEELLCEIQPSRWMLASSFFVGFVSLSVVTVLASFITQVLVGEVVPFFFVAGFGLAYGAFCFLKWKVWQHASFRITNKRILLLHPGGLIPKSSPKAIKWDRYQESALRSNIIHKVIRANTLDIYYGTAGAERQTSYPFLPFAEDLKHYLDKVDNAVREGAVQEVKPFVAKARGQRF